MRHRVERRAVPCVATRSVPWLRCMVHRRGETTRARHPVPNSATARISPGRRYQPQLRRGGRNERQRI
jgi:hypothetical protein